MKLIQGDSIQVMGELEAYSVDLILCDLPYGITRNSWDTLIPFESLWPAYRRLLRPDGAIVLFASPPFSSTLCCSNLSEFRYEFVWNKVNRVSGHLNAKNQPMRMTERILVFSQNSAPRYFPVMTAGVPYRAVSAGRKSNNFGKQRDRVTTESNGERFPRDLLEFEADERGTEGRIHPTQKPVDLLSYLIRTYTQDGETVLDNCMGSGSTGVACIRTGRNFVGIELDGAYYDGACSRINQALSLQVSHPKFTGLELQG